MTGFQPQVPVGTPRRSCPGLNTVEFAATSPENNKSKLKFKINKIKKVIKLILIIWTNKKRINQNKNLFRTTNTKGTKAYIRKNMYKKINRILISDGTFSNGNLLVCRSGVTGWQPWTARRWSHCPPKPTRGSWTPASLPHSPSPSGWRSVDLAC